ncbi:DUF2732 family protein [Escherichia coli]|uniref:DUF2732 family protein n=1 Tax=Escherichia coli TaxID=562 RepID=UPI000B42C211|nr:DUF2732 family protein [Escherichia coli]EGY1272140.1 DUF2732 family protein [Escherichia coli]EHP5222770.1 DUF2732 family protein [Escherichia coli]EHY6873953.1 DUF2732 family protein [Escherichia coli]EIZ9114762.1 DUF2732 family protein [Escherichia coli]EJC0086263.1 DUF2732 family protein [Escherichia coli]
MNKQMSVPRSNMKALLAQAAGEAQLVTATRFASALDSLIAHICKSEMNCTEIIELLGQESEKLHNSILNQQ